MSKENTRADIPDNIKKEVRAVLLSKVGGVPVTQFHSDFFRLVGHRLEWVKLGYPNVTALLEAIPDVARIALCPKDKKKHVYGLCDKGMFMNCTAKKAQYKERAVPKSARSESSSSANNMAKRDLTPQQMELLKEYEEALVPNMRGWYALCIRIQPGLTREVLTEEFEKFGEIAELAISLGRHAFIRYYDKQSCLDAVLELDGVYSIQPATERQSPREPRKPSDRIPQASVRVGGSSLSDVDSGQEVQNGELLNMLKSASISPATSHRSTPERSTPQRSMPERSIPQRSMTERSMPERSVPERSTPERSIPQRPMPQRSTPQRSMPQRQYRSSSQSSEDSVKQRPAPKQAAPYVSQDKGRPPNRDQQSYKGRPPNMVEKASENTIFIGNLPMEMKDAEVSKLVQNFNVLMIRNRVGPNGTRYAFLDVPSRAEGRKIINALHGSVLKLHTLIVEESHAPDKVRTPGSNLAGSQGNRGAPALSMPPLEIPDHIARDQQYAGYRVVGGDDNLLEQELDDLDEEYLQEEEYCEDIQHAFDLSVSNFPYGTSSYELYRLFEPYGATEVVMKNNMYHPDNIKTMCTVWFLDFESADRAVADLMSCIFKGRLLTVNFGWHSHQVPNQMQNLMKNMNCTINISVSDGDKRQVVLASGDSKDIQSNSQREAPHRDSLLGPGPQMNSPQGQVPYRNSPQGQVPYRNSAQGQAPYRNSAQGQAPYRNSAQGQAPYRNSAQGQAPYRNSAQGQPPYRNSPQGQAFHMNSPQGRAPYRNSPQGQAPYRNSPQGQALPRNSPQAQALYRDSIVGRNSPQGQASRIVYGQSPQTQTPLRNSQQGQPQPRNSPQGDSPNVSSSYPGAQAPDVREHNVPDSNPASNPESDNQAGQSDEEHLLPSEEMTLAAPAPSESESVPAAPSESSTSESVFVELAYTDRIHQDCCPDTEPWNVSSLPSCLEILPTHFIDDSHVWANLVFDSVLPVVEEFQAMSEQLQREETLLPFSTGEHRVAAHYCGDWYRAWIKSLDGEVAQVFFIDYGNSETVSLDLLRCLPDELWKVRPMAVPVEIPEGGSSALPTTSLTTVLVDPDCRTFPLKVVVPSNA